MSKNPLAHDQRLPSQFYEPTYEDDISLIDLWLVLAKRKTLIAAAAGLCLLSGLLFALDFFLRCILAFAARHHKKAV